MLLGQNMSFAGTEQQLGLQARTPVGAKGQGALRCYMKHRWLTRGCVATLVLSVGVGSCPSCPAPGGLGCKCGLS